MKTRKIILPALAVILVIGLAVGTAIAYFTAHTEATGSVPVALGAETEIQEKIVNNEKLVTISNKGPQAVWVRAKAFSAYELNYEGTNWELGDDEFYEYKEIVEANQSTSTLKVSIKELESLVTEEFNVIVIYECTPVQYDDVTGEPIETPEWDLEVNPITTEGGE